MGKEIFDLYTDYLLASFRLASATSLSAMTGGRISHDRVTRFLRSEEIGSQDLWRNARPFVREIESDNGVIVVDDSISEKPYTDENEIICWHWDHSKQRNVKGINFVTALYVSNEISVPVGCELVKKTIKVKDEKTNREKRISDRSKNEMFRDMIRNCKKQNIKFQLVLADIWYSSSENMTNIKNDLKKDFIFPLKSNRKIALSKKEKSMGQWTPLESVKFRKGEVRTVYLEGVNFPLQLIKQIFKNDDGSTGTLYLVCSIQDVDFDFITTNYHKRWKVEEYHKSLKQNVSLEKSPAKIVRTQTNHFFSALCAFVKLQRITLSVNTNHFALKGKLYIQALKVSFHYLSGLQTVRT